MKKVIFTIFMTSCIAFSVNAVNNKNTSNNNEQIVAVSSTSYEYTFVGTFGFHAKGYIYEYDVYEQKTVIDGYLITTYYAKVNDKYYKLISCNYKYNSTTYNYYFSYQGDKYYVQI